MNSYADLKKKYEDQFRNGELLGHSELAETYRDANTLWLKIKNRHSGNIVQSNVINAIFDWSEYVGIRTESSLSRNPAGWRRHPSIMYCDEYFTAIFPIYNWQKTAAIITWGEYFTTRNLNVPSSQSY